MQSCCGTVDLMNSPMRWGFPEIGSVIRMIEMTIAE